MILDAGRAVISDREVFEHGSRLIEETAERLMRQCGALNVRSGRLQLIRSDFRYTTELNVVFDSQAWTGRTASTSAVGVFVAGPIVWVRSSSGRAWCLRIGRVLIFRLPTGWRLGLL